MKIGNRQIGNSAPVYIIAELSANHNGNFDRAIDIVKAAADSGADAIKLQTYTADTLTLNSDKDYFKLGKGTLWEGRVLYDLYKEAYTPWEWQPKLKEEAERLGMDCFSTPFDDTAVDFLEEMDVLAYKIASFELVDIPLIKYTASKMKPMIISTGMATVEEIQDAVDAVFSTGNRSLALLKCTSSYPANPDGMNLKTISDMSKRFGVVAGLSDHSLSNDIAVASVALGAKIIEKHITLSRGDAGTDAGFSMEPAEFAKMVKSVRMTEKALGAVSYQITDQEQASRCFRRSLFAVENIKAGDKITRTNIRSIRPSDGLKPKYLEEILGKKLKIDIMKGTPLELDFITS